MTTLEVSSLTQVIADLLTEAYAGPPNPRETWFIDNEPDSGILGILTGVTAEEASTSVDGSGQPGTTIAANAEHLRWSLANTNNAIRGQEYSPNWSESWNLIEADPEKWDRLRQDLRAEYETLVELTRAIADLPGVYLPGMLALLPHAAYHLGTIRQMIERIRG